MEKCYCPICGHEYKQGEYEINYETGNTDYHCPECEHDCTHMEVISTSNVLDKMEDMKDDFDLEGVELTEEDANLVISKVIEYGDDYEDAVKSVLSGIGNCLNEEETDLSDKLRHYGGSYNKRTLKKEGLCIVTWPDSQCLCEMPNFWEHAWLINDTYGLNRFGSCAYVVEQNWLEE